MESSSFSIHAFTPQSLEATGFPEFDTYINYSKFKYGCGITARKFGHELFRKFVLLYPNWKQYADKLVITSSAYKHVPTASYGLGLGFFEAINKIRYFEKKQPIPFIQIYRTNVFEGDYGCLSLSDRRQIMELNQLHVDAKLIKNKTLIICDDIRITGTHEAKLDKVLSNIPDLSVVHAYIAICSGLEAEIESHLNHAFIHNLNDLLPIIQSEGFLMNARVVKFVLSYPNLQETSYFFEQLSFFRLNQFYRAAIGDGYANMLTYSRNFELLSKILSVKESSVLFRTNKVLK